jgi:hypothetical protein
MKSLMVIALCDAGIIHSFSITYAHPRGRGPSTSPDVRLGSAEHQLTVPTAPWPPAPNPETGTRISRSAVLPRSRQHRQYKPDEGASGLANHTIPRRSRGDHCRSRVVWRYPRSRCQTMPPSCLTANGRNRHRGGGDSLDPRPALLNDFTERRRRGIERVEHRAVTELRPA